MLKATSLSINSGTSDCSTKFTCDSYRWRRTLQYGYNLHDATDPTNPGGGNGNTGGNNGNTGGNTGNNGATGGNNGNGSNTGSNPNGGSGLGTTGSGLGSLGNGLGTNGSGYNPKLSTISYGTGNHGKQATYLVQVKRVLSRDNKFVWRLCRTPCEHGNHQTQT